MSLFPVEQILVKPYRVLTSTQFQGYVLIRNRILALVYPNISIDLKRNCAEWGRYIIASMSEGKTVRLSIFLWIMHHVWANLDITMFRKTPSHLNGQLAERIWTPARSCWWERVEELKIYLQNKWSTGIPSVGVCAIRKKTYFTQPPNGLVCYS